MRIDEKYWCEANQIGKMVTKWDSADKKTHGIFFSRIWRVPSKNTNIASIDNGFNTNIPVTETHAFERLVASFLLQSLSITNNNDVNISQRYRNHTYWTETMNCKRIFFGRNNWDSIHHYLFVIFVIIIKLLSIYVTRMSSLK